MSFGQRLKHLRQELDLTQAELAARVGAPLLSADAARYDAVLSPARDQLDETAWREAWQTGKAAAVAEMLAAALLEQAIDQLQVGPRPRATAAR